MKPRYVTGPAERETRPVTGGIILKYPCDDGKKHTVNELAEIAGFTKAAMSALLRNDGWKTVDLTRKPMTKQEVGAAGHAAWINSTLSKIPDKPRDENLRKMKVGSWEQRHCGAGP